MWDSIVRALATFPSAVLTWVDEAGFPASARVEPVPDADRQVVRIDPPAGFDPRPGPASLLAHAHNEVGWNLKSCLVRGQLEQDGTGWVLRPLAFVPGAGVGGPLDQVRPLFRPRATAKRYLARRGLARPTIPWDRIKSTYS